MTLRYADCTVLLTHIKLAIEYHSNEAGRWRNCGMFDKAKISQDAVTELRTLGKICAMPAEIVLNVETAALIFLS